ncbi:hypothetical protein D7X12_15670 [Corallococcus sicarius]|uniref:HEPN AbiU2-like domain-containing protein n=2 Tax=Corallococcus sicarius TaxID=2316726 RepID=A0A3A8NDU8_9BACT|nr:hypothetical protein D7X12_15670 [Corallococcus sicarius]
MLDEAIEAYVVTKRRYPLLRAIAQELDKVMGQLSAKKTSRRRVRIWNDAVLQLARDSFDMFVIDLFSIRERLVRRGLLHLLEKDCARLKRCDPSEISTRPAIISGNIGGPEDYARIQAEVQQHHRELVTQSINGALDGLIPGEYPVTPQGVQTLVKRFMKETEPLERDRNRVRAHRYERHFDVQHFQSLDDLQSQLDIFERLLGDLYLVLTRNSFIFRLDFHASTEGTAQDLADIMVHGSINSAVNAYRVARKTNKNPVPWYYFHREKFFESPPNPEDEQGGG